MQIRLKGFPECYGDLDFFKLIERESNYSRFKEEWQGEREALVSGGFSMM